MHLLRRAERTPMPWKNGGGETIEIAVHPSGAGLSEFDWRISTARVTEDGIFSVFEGIDRTLCLTDGLSLDLEIDGLGHRRLTRDSPPLFFPGDARTSAYLREGPVSDLNVMTRRGVWKHRVERRTLVGSTAIECSAGWNVLVLAGPCRLEGKDFAEDAASGDALLLGPDGDSVTIDVRTQMTMFLINIY